MKTIPFLLVLALTALILPLLRAATPVTKTPATPQRTGGTPAAADAAGTVSAASLPLAGTGYYLDQGKWAAINPNERKAASVKFTAPARNGA